MSGKSDARQASRESRESAPSLAEELFAAWRFAGERQGKHLAPWPAQPLDVREQWGAVATAALNVRIRIDGPVDAESAEAAAVERNK